MKRIMIGAASSGSGKTTVTLGLLRVLKKRNLTVQPYKVGSDVEIEKERDGVIVNTWTGGNTLASYLHIHSYQHLTLLYRLLEKGRQMKCI